MKKPAWSNTTGYSTTPVYSSTGPPAWPGCPSSSHPTLLDSPILQSDEESDKYTTLYHIGCFTLCKCKSLPRPIFRHPARPGLRVQSPWQRCTVPLSARRVPQTSGLVYALVGFPGIGQRLDPLCRLAVVGAGHPAAVAPEPRRPRQAA